MVGIAQPVEHLVVVQGVAGSSPVTHPRWVRFELLTKGPLLVGVRAWPDFFCFGGPGEHVGLQPFDAQPVVRHLVPDSHVFVLIDVDRLE